MTISRRPGARDQAPPPVDAACLVRCPVVDLHPAAMLTEL
jgi:hypothetical protein